LKASTKSGVFQTQKRKRIAKDFGVDFVISFFFEVANQFCTNLYTNISFNLKFAGFLFPAWISKATKAIIFTVIKLHHPSILN